MTFRETPAGPMNDLDRMRIAPAPDDPYRGHPVLRGPWTTVYASSSSGGLPPLPPTNPGDPPPVKIASPPVRPQPVRPGPVRPVRPGPKKENK